eukprot:Nk52_evm12s2568 gene=Nk52_evmTU12s2568
MSVKWGYETTQRIDTEYSADVVETCPVGGGRGEVVLCGTYQLKDAPEAERDPNVAKERHGRLLVYGVVDGREEGTMVLREEERVECAAVLDAKWSHQVWRREGECDQGTAVVGVVDAVGQLNVYALEENKAKEKEGEGERSPSYGLSMICSGGKTVEEGCLYLSLDWSDRIGAVSAMEGDTQEENNPPSSDPSSRRVAVSQSDGQVSLWSLSESRGLSQLQTWQAHDYEAWITAFDYHHPEIVFSGGDDCLLRGWDTRSACASPIFANRRCHSMGVCSIQSHPSREEVFASGSYDENICVWDRRQMRQPLVTIEGGGGGVWRLKWCPSSGCERDWLFAACMHNGYYVYDVDILGGGASTITAPLVHYPEHESLAYGADWVRRVGAEDDKETEKGETSEDTSGWWMATCSFYDHSLQMWKMSVEE